MGRRPSFELLWPLVALLAAPALAAGPEHQAPVENLAAPQARSDESSRQSLLTEMWQRRILSNESRSWTAEDLDLLLKLRSAEQLGAIALLKRRAGGSLGGLVVPFKPAGEKTASLRLTREGFDRWQFYRSQDAIDYFEQKGSETGMAFQLEDMGGQRLFDATGRLTAAGDAVYDRALANLPVWWRQPHTGEVFGTRPPSQAKAPEPAPEAAAAAAVSAAADSVPAGPEHAGLLQQLYAKQGRPYQPELRVTELGRLRIVTEHESTLNAGPDGYVVVVARAKDKAAARREIARRLPQLGSIPREKILTVAEKLAEMDAAIARLSSGAERWQVDRAAVEKQLRDLLKGKLAAAWVLSNQPPPSEPPPSEAPPAAEAAPAPAAPPLQDAGAPKADAPASAEGPASDAKTDAAP